MQSRQLHAVMEAGSGDTIGVSEWYPMLPPALGPPDTGKRRWMSLFRSTSYMEEGKVRLEDFKISFNLDLQVYRTMSSSALMSLVNLRTLMPFSLDKAVSLMSWDSSLVGGT